MGAWEKINKKSFLILLIVGVLFLPLPATNLWWQEAFNSGHTLVFMALSYLLVQQFSLRCFFSNILLGYIIAFMVVMLTGVVVELLQGLVGREMSWGDLQNDFFGSLAGLSLFFLKQNQIAGDRKQNKKRLFSVVAWFCVSGFFLLGTFSLLQLSWHYIQRDKAFPVIVDFAESWSDSFVRYKKVSLVSRVESTDAMYEFQFEPGEYPGINILEPEKDWSSYSKLHFRIFSSYKQTAFFVLRIHDRWHDQSHADRFNRRLLVEPGLNDIVLEMRDVEEGPAERRLDLQNIAGIIIFLSEFEESRKYRISNLYLE